MTDDTAPGLGRGSDPRVERAASSAPVAVTR